MARRFLNDIKVDVTANLASNINGDISAADLRPIMDDMIDSLKQDEAELVATGATNGLATTVAFADLETVYGAQSGGDGTFLKPVFAQGTIELSTVPGFSYTILGRISISGTNNVAIRLSVGINGSEVGFVTAVEATGAAEFETMSVRHFINAVGVDDVITLMLSTPDGVSSVNIEDAQLVVVIVPTNDA